MRDKEVLECFSVRHVGKKVDLERWLDEMGVCVEVLNQTCFLPWPKTKRLYFHLFPNESKGWNLHSWKIYSCGLTVTLKAKDAVVALIVDSERIFCS